MVAQSRTTPALTVENLVRGGWLIQNISIVKWGTEVVLQAVFDADLPDTTQFTLTFSDCLNVVWNTDENQFDERDKEADVIGFDLFDSDTHQKAVVTTDLFWLEIEYRQLALQTHG